MSEVPHCFKAAPRSPQNGFTSSQNFERHEFLTTVHDISQSRLQDHYQTQFTPNTSFHPNQYLSIRKGLHLAYLLYQHGCGKEDEKVWRGPLPRKFLIDKHEY